VTLGASFHCMPLFIDGFCFLVALVLAQDLLLCAKYLFFPATVAGCAQHPRQGAGSPAGKPSQRRPGPQSVLNSPESGLLGSWLTLTLGPEQQITNLNDRQR
jgi:hypothetical protein